jgi:hypothetical protein
MELRRHLYVGKRSRGDSSSRSSSVRHPSLPLNRLTRLQLLYTTTSESCLLNDEYINDFEKPVDVFATSTKGRAQ